MVFVETIRVSIEMKASLDSKDFDAQSDLFSSLLFCSFCAYSYYSFFPMYNVVNPFSSIQYSNRSMHPTSKICRKVVIKTNRRNKIRKLSSLHSSSTGLGYTVCSPSEVSNLSENSLFDILLPSMALDDIGLGSVVVIVAGEKRCAPPQQQSRCPMK